jgi:hypothetical protein
MTDCGNFYIGPRSVKMDYGAERRANSEGSNHE